MVRHESLVQSVTSSIRNINEQRMITLLLNHFTILVHQQIVTTTDCNTVDRVNKPLNITDI